MAKFGVALVVALTLLFGTISGAGAGPTGTGIVTGSFNLKCGAPTFTIGPLTLSGTLIVEGITRSVALKTGTFVGSSYECHTSGAPPSTYAELGTFGNAPIAGFELNGGPLTGTCGPAYVGGAFSAISNTGPLGPATVHLDLACTISDGIAPSETHLISIEGETPSLLAPSQFAGTYTG